LMQNTVPCSLQLVEAGQTQDRSLNSMLPGARHQGFQEFVRSQHGLGGLRLSRFNSDGTPLPTQEHHSTAGRSSTAQNAASRSTTWSWWIDVGNLGVFHATQPCCPALIHWPWLPSLAAETARIRINTVCDRTAACLPECRTYGSRC
jgi:hypothetical protein